MRALLRTLHVSGTQAKQFRRAPLTPEQESWASGRDMRLFPRVPGESCDVDCQDWFHAADIRAEPGAMGRTAWWKCLNGDLQRMVRSKNLSSPGSPSCSSMICMHNRQHSFKPGFPVNNTPRSLRPDNLRQLDFLCNPSRNALCW